MSVYAVASGKGGVGKTTTAIALAACAGAADASAIVVDADLGMADIGTFLGLDDEGPTLYGVLAGRADLDAAIRKCGGFAALPTSADLDEYAGADPAGLREVVADLRERYDVIILDTGAGLSHDTVLPLGLADEVIPVSTPDEVSVRDTDKTHDIVDRIGGTIRGTVFNRAVETDLEEIAGDLDGELLGVVPEDDVVREAAAARIPVPAFAPGSPAGTAYMDIAATLFELPVTAIKFEDGDTADAGIEGAAVEPFSGETADAEADPPGESSEEAVASGDAPEGVDEAESDVDGAADHDGTESEADAAETDDEPEPDADGADADEAESRGFLSRLFGR